MAQYPIPPWLQPPNAAAAASTAASARANAANIALQRDKMRQDYELSAMEAQLKAEALNQQTLRDQHKLEIDRAYRDAQIGLREQQLGQQQMLNEQRMQLGQVGAAQRQQQLDINQERADLSASEAANIWLARKQWHDRVVVGKEDPEKVMKEIGPLMTRSTAGFGSMFRAPDQLLEPGAAFDVPNAPHMQGFRTGPRSFTYRERPATTGGGAPVPQPVPGYPGLLNIPRSKDWTTRTLPRIPESEEMKRLKKTLGNLQEDYDEDPDDETQERIRDLEKRIEALRKAEQAYTPPAYTNAPAATSTNRLRIIGIEGP